MKHLVCRFLCPRLLSAPRSLATAFRKRDYNTSDDDDGFVDAATKNAEMDNAAGTIDVVEIDVVI